MSWQDYQQQPPSGGWQQQPPGGWQPRPTSGKATASLILGILGLVFCPLICSILGLIFGYQARSEIAASGGQIDGRGQAQAGIVLSWIGVVLSALGILFFIGVLLLAGSSEFSTV